MDDKKIVNVDDINYAIYRVGNWDNEYQINQVGLSEQIPVTEYTVKHVKSSMEEIRSAEFGFSDKTVNGFVAIALQLFPELQDRDTNEVIQLEEKEYENILNELDNLELLDENETVPIDSEEYLIYKLQKECHVTTSTPANEFTLNFQKEEMRKLEEALG